MKMRESDIFNNYIRLATDAGLISEDDLIKTADPNDKTRYDSYSFSDIEALYGHKFAPNKEEGQSILDVAHPETMVVGPAYDAMNAIVENLHQRQDIMSYIALKTPDGHLIQRRYVKASQDLINSLISIGFNMDSLNEEGLMSLADICAGKIEKRAFPPMAAAAVALVGALGYLMYGSTSSQNVSVNSQLVIERGNELSSKAYASSIIKEVSALKELADMFFNAKDAVIANSIEDVVDKAAEQKSKAMIDLIENYQKQQGVVINKIPTWKAAITSSIESGDQDISSDTWHKLTSMFGSVVPDKWISYFQNSGAADERMLLEELDALYESIQESQSVIGSVNQMARGYGPEIQKVIKEKEEQQQFDMFKQNTSDPAKPVGTPDSDLDTYIKENFNF